MIGLLRQLDQEGLAGEALIREGEIASAVVGVAKELGAELLVLGTHGRKGLSRWFQGSIAEAIVRDAPCPVMVRRFQHHAGCEARSCEWCTTDITPATLDVLAEAMG